ncbi:MAG: immunoglobulin-like domain-containing protein [Eubacteriales bacterium]
MKRKMLVRLSCVAAAVLLAFGGYVYYTLTSDSGERPVITMESDTITISISDGEDAVINGITAYDAEDGDITGRLIYEGLSAFSEEGVCTATFTAVDSDGNVSKAQRTVVYSDYTPPVFALKAPLTFSYGSTMNLSDYIRAYDCIDGDISGSVRITLTGSSGSLSEIGVHPVTVRVTNSKGDTAELTLDVTVAQIDSAQKRYAPTIELSDYLIYVDEGGAFSPSELIVSVTDGGVRYTDSAHISGVSFSGNVNTSRPGVYRVEYEYTGEKGYTGTAALVVVVTGE